MARGRGSGHGGPRRSRTVRTPKHSRAIDALVRAPSSPCPGCGRNSKTVQGVCADCWAPKGGRPMGWRKQPPGEGGGGRLEDFALGCLAWPVFLAATVVVAWAS